MPQKLISDSPEELIREAEELLSIAEVYLDRLKVKGITEETLKTFKTLISNNKKLMSAHTAEIGKKEMLTAKQNKAIEDGIDWIRNVQSSAKMAFRDQPGKKKEFRIGEKLPKLVGKVLDIGRAVYQAAEENLEALKPRGIDETVLKNGEAILENLEEINSKQESAKKIQFSKRMLRDKGFKEMIEIDRDIREAGKSVFRKEKEIANQFKKYTSAKKTKSEGQG